MAEILIDNLKKDPTDLKVNKLRILKNDLIGCQEKKEFYFNQGIIETLLSMVGSEVDESLLQEIITIINCYFFDFPKAIECFKVYSHTFIQMHFLLQTHQQSGQLIDMILRVIKNELISGIVKSSDFENHSLIEELGPLMSSRARVSIISKIIALVCQYPYFREQISKNKIILESILAQITQNLQIISDECLENCLSALAEASNNNKENSLTIYHYPKFLDQAVKYLRHPEKNIKIQSAKILTHINKYHKLPREFSQSFRWIIMQMVQLLPLQYSDPSQIIEICQIIQSIAQDSKDKKSMQKIAGDIQAIEKISDLLVASKNNEAFDLDMNGNSDQMQVQNQIQSHLFQVLAALTSHEDSCRKKLVENKKLLGELLIGIKSSSRDVKYSVCQCFVSLSRSDKMVKSIILEAGDFHKELQNILITSDKDQELQLSACKALCNLGIDFQKHLAKEDTLLKKIVELTFSENIDLKTAACFTLKNLLFKCPKEVKVSVLKELTHKRLLELLDDDNLKVQEQILMIYRNLLYNTDSDINQVINDAGPEFLNKIEKKLNSNNPVLVVQALYVISSVASGNQKNKKLVLEDRFFNKALELLKSSDLSNIKIAVLNLIMNLAYKESDSSSDGKARKHILDMNLGDMLAEMKEKERDLEVKTYLERIIIKLR